MLRSATILRQELHGHDVERALHEALPAGFRPPIFPLAVMNRNLADLEAPAGREDRHEAVHLGVKVNLAQYLRAICLEAAVVVVQVNLRDRTDHAVEDMARERLVPRIVSNLLPSAHHVKAAADSREE